jgi:hypothetical protein
VSSPGVIRAQYAPHAHRIPASTNTTPSTPIARRPLRRSVFTGSIWPSAVCTVRTGVRTVLTR